MNKYQIRKYLLDIDERLEKGYWLESLIEDFYNSKLHHFIDAAKTLSNWKEYIINSLITVDSLDGGSKRRLSNGPVEGINSLIEKINVNGNGYSNFYRFINRCAYVINKNVLIKNK